MAKLYYCNPHTLVGEFELTEATERMKRSDYCMYVVHDGVVVASTARETPWMLVGHKVGA